MSWKVAEINAQLQEIWSISYYPNKYPTWMKRYISHGHVYKLCRLDFNHEEIFSSATFSLDVHIASKSERFFNLRINVM